MSDQIPEGTIPAAAAAVIELFRDELAEVRFPDLDHAVLQDAALRVMERAAALGEAEARLQAAREALRESQEALLSRCQRALAYARVYAEDNPALAQRIEALAPPRLRPRAAAPGESEPRPPLRRRRSGAPSGAAPGALFLGVSGEPGEAAAP